MPVTSARTGFHLAAPVLAVVVLSSCVLGPRTSFRPTSSTTVFSAREIAAYSPLTAYDAVSRLRPQILYGNRARRSEPLVYLDGMKLGGLDVLPFVSAADLVEIRFLNAIEAGVMFGPTKPYGEVILLTTALGRNRPVF